MHFPSGFSLDPKRGAGRVALSVVALMALVMIPAAAVTHLTGEYTFTSAHDPLAISASNLNRKSGSAGIQGTSGVGIGIVGDGGTYGVQGQTKATATQSTGYPPAGVFGIGSTAGTGKDAGVLGVASGGDAGVVGISNAGPALEGFSGPGPAIVGDGNGFHGGVGYVGLGGGEGGVFWGYPSGAANSGALHPALVARAGGFGEDLIASYSVNSNGTATPETFIVQAGTQDRSRDTLDNGSDVQVSGDLYVYGRVYTDCDAFPTISTTTCSGGPLVSQQATSTGAKVSTYSPQQSMKTVEDFGEAQIVGGHAYVPLDRTFASSIDGSRSYLVFITPESDSRGLYVTGKSTSGFTVRESMGGSSSLVFQYRIVAHPYGDTTARMAVIREKNRLPTVFASNENDPKVIRSRLLTPAILQSLQR
jgi:hypothetical protein